MFVGDEEKLKQMMDASVPGYVPFSNLLIEQAIFSLSRAFYLN